MSDNTVSPDTDNLDDFEALFNGKATAAPKEPEAVETEEVEAKEGEPEDSPLATEEVGDLGEDDDSSDEDKSDSKAKKKPSFQERMNEVTAARRQAERERDELLARLEALEKVTRKEPEPVAPVVQEDGTPDPDDINEDGSAKYPQGEFDPKYIRDLVKFETMRERQELAAKDAQEQAQRQALDAKTALNEQWQEKIKAVETTIPDIREKGAALDEAFVDIDAAYGEYLATTIMTMDHGPEVLNYLADNIDEARRITRMGAVGATIALGELHSQFKSKPTSKPKVTSAPEPPSSRVRGTSGRFQTADDTDDLTAFESKFYGK